MWRRNLRSKDNQLTGLATEPTSNILEALSPDHAIYGDPEPPIADGTPGSGRSHRGSQTVGFQIIVPSMAKGSVKNAGNTKTVTESPNNHDTPAINSVPANTRPR